MDQLARGVAYAGGEGADAEDLEALEDGEIAEVFYGEFTLVKRINPVSPFTVNSYWQRMSRPIMASQGWPWALSGKPPTGEGMCYTQKRNLKGGFKIGVVSFSGRSSTAMGS